MRLAELAKTLSSFTPRKAIVLRRMPIIFRKGVGPRQAILSAADTGERTAPITRTGNLRKANFKLHCPQRSFLPVLHIQPSPV